MNHCITSSNSLYGSSNCHPLFCTSAAAASSEYAQDLIQHNRQVGNGSEGFKQFFGPHFEGFPDSHTTIEHMIAEDNLVMAFLNTTATRTGEYLGAPPTNKTIVMRAAAADLFRIEDGMIAEQWDVADSLNLLTQTGGISFNQ
jgi:predicted SnoaL-like aldol condensation-catalyzing enzyme